MKKINIALIGAGKTMEQHIKALLSIKDYKINLNGIFSRTTSKAEILKKKYKIRYLCKNVDDLYEKSNADILIMVVSVESVKKLALKVSNFKWKIFCEKPFGINLNENNFLKKKLGKKKNNFFIGLNRMFYDSVYQANKMLKKDKTIRILNVYDQQDFNQFKKKSNYKKIIKNLQFSNSIHMFSLMRALVRGKLKNIKNIFNNSENSQQYIIKKIIFTSGDTVLFHSLWNRSGPWKLDLSTNDYFFTFDPIEEVKYREKKIKRYQKFPEIVSGSNIKAGFKNQLEFFFKSYLDKNKKFNYNISDELMNLIKKFYQN